MVITVMTWWSYRFLTWWSKGSWLGGHRDRRLIKILRKLEPEVPPYDLALDRPARPTSRALFVGWRREAYRPRARIRRRATVQGSRPPVPGNNVVAGAKAAVEDVKVLADALHREVSLGGAAGIAHIAAQGGHASSCCTVRPAWRAVGVRGSVTPGVGGTSNMARRSAGPHARSKSGKFRLG